jgi:hypothetical protein
MWRAHFIRDDEGKKDVARCSSPIVVATASSSTTAITAVRRHMTGALILRPRRVGASSCSEGREQWSHGGVSHRLTVKL